MNYFSTKHTCDPVSFEDAIFNSLPPDNGLYYPEEIPRLDPDWLHGLSRLSHEEIGFEVARHFIGGEIESDTLRRIVSESVDFDFPLVQIDDSVYAFELYHGPTWAFKDVGARFLSRCMAYFNQKRGREVTILVATSGDTGGAVAAGFHGVPGTTVKILFPKGKVSELQQQQLTTWGDNIEAFEIDGTFDDCQRLVKAAFLDTDLREQLNLSSANSINIARLIPQSFYYFFARQQVDRDPVICVPSGNYGNLTAGLFARKMGLPMQRFVAASNANQVVPDYLETGTYTPRSSIATLANAMDVGDPSNFVRMLELFGSDVERMRSWISGFHLDDAGIREAIRECHTSHGYVLDPHGAVGYQALRELLAPDETGIFFETAHPVKFFEVVHEVLGDAVDYTDKIDAIMHKSSSFTSLSGSFDDFKGVLMG